MTQVWTPSGKWMQTFREALDDAFSDADLEVLTSDYFHPQSFSKVAPPAGGLTFEYRLQQLIQWARMNDRLPDLVNAARERRPANVTIAGIATDLGLTVGGGARLDNPTGHALEEIIRANALFLDPARVVERLAALEAQLCWLEIPGGGGTGFLAGPDLVITNHHVAQRITSGRARRQDVRAVFDYRATSIGTTLRRPPLEVPLAEDFLVGSWAPSASDEDPQLSDALPGEIDVAVLRLASAIGDEPVGGPSADPGATLRGWVDAGATPAPMTAGNQVFLLQHPRGEPQRLSVGTVTGFNGNGTRMRYDANSRDGSSGSPCFNADFELVAVHHARDPQVPPSWNQAVPLGLIHTVFAAANLELSGA